MSFSWRAPSPSAGDPSLNATAPTFNSHLAPAQALQALLASGPLYVDITAERENVAAFPDRPQFLQGVRYDRTEARVWFEEVLPFLSNCTFVISSTADIVYSGDIFGSAALPRIYSAVTKVELPKFYWFSGVALNRHHNPYLQVCGNLPNLHELSITFHTAGLTAPRWSDRQITTLEQNQPEAAKERILLSLREVVLRYELNAIFACVRLRRLRLNYIESKMTAYFCKVGIPLDVLEEISTYLGQGFSQRGLQVIVELVHVKVETLT
ncbi:hypothetical protein SVAN01_10100 [Stagonosporopsis vannaccii]|nr:hypothetical protein SVAN01_10100 [Stagonosporopsis vannaccii]